MQKERATAPCGKWATAPCFNNAPSKVMLECTYWLNAHCGRTPQLMQERPEGMYGWHEPKLNARRAATHVERLTHQNVYMKGNEQGSSTKRTNN